MRREDPRDSEERFTRAEALLVELLDSRAREADIDSLCARHPDVALELRELHAEWRRLNSALEDARPGPDPTPLWVQELLARLARRTGNWSDYSGKQRVAAGGMGEIASVRDGILERDLAMKLVLGPAGLPQTTVRLVRFLKEARITGGLDHPGIVPVHDLGLDPEGRVYFTMKLVKGRNLEAAFDAAAAVVDGWNETRALNALLKVCEAVAFAHQNGVIHRDLKPANVMVGDFGEVYVMDWGLARVIGQPDLHDLRLRIPDAGGTSQTLAGSRAHSPLQTMDGDLVGTPAYMPPEQAVGDVNRIGPASDVYAIGAMLYHLLARQRPYVPAGERKSSVAVLRAVIDGPPVPLATLRRDLAPELVAVVEKAMARDLEHRYPNVVELARDLRAFLENRVVRAYRTGAIPELSKWVARNRGLAWSSAAALLVALLGLGGMSAVQAAGRSEAQAREASTARVASVLTDVFRSFAPENRQGKDVSAIDLLDFCEAKIIQLQEPLDQPTVADLEVSLGIAFRKLGKPERAERSLRKGVGLLELLRSRPQSVVLAQRELGIVCTQLGRWVEARSWLESALRLAESVPDDREWIATVHCIGQLSKSRGEYGEAEESFRAVLERLEGRTDEARAPAMLALAQILRLNGNYGEAEEWLDRILALEQRDMHPDRMQAENSLAVLYNDQGRFDEAIALLEPLLDARVQVLGDQHEDIVRTRVNLGHALYGKRDLEGARLLYEEAVSSHQGNPDTESTLSGMLGLADVLVAQGEAGEAEPIYRDLMARAESALGAGHQIRLFAANGLAKVYTDQGRWAEAYGLLSPALRVMIERYGENHPKSQDLRRNLVIVCGQMGVTEEHRELLQEFLRREPVDGQLFEPARRALQSLDAEAGDPGD